MPAEPDSDEPRRRVNQAVEQALVAHRRAFRRFLVRRLGQEADAEDVLQELFVRALTKGHAIRKEESVVAWLYRCLGSVLADHMRRQARRTRHIAAYAREQPADSGAVDEDLRQSICECLHLLLPAMRPEYTELIERIDLAGEPRSQVAATLGLTMSNLAVRLHRARQALRRALLLSCTTCPEHGFLDCGCELPIRGRTAAGLDRHASVAEGSN